MCNIRQDLFFAFIYNSVRGPDCCGRAVPFLWHPTQPYHCCRHNERQSSFCDYQFAPPPQGRTLAGTVRRERTCRETQCGMGKTLFVAGGSGLNFSNLPPEAEIVAIDIDRGKLVRAQERART